MAFLVGSCEKNEIKTDLPLRTVIVYMIADNNLDYFSVQDINEMERGFNTSFDGNLIVYVDRGEGATPSHPIVYEIAHDTTETIASEITFVYKEQNSANEIVMSNVLSDIVTQYPAQSYGLVLWSHGTAWYPEGTNIDVSNETTVKRLPLTKSFGKDKTNELNISKLKNVFPVHFDFLIFDACYMGSIEVVYALKDQVDYIVSSPTVVLSAGYPYAAITGLLFDPEIDYKKLAIDFFESYNSLSDALQSATVSVIQTAKLPDLAKRVADIMNDTNSLKKANFSNIQQYTANQGGFLFDLEDFISQSSSNSKLIDRFKSTLSEVIVYKIATQKIVDNLEINRFSGLSMGITANDKYYDFYKTLDWYKDSDYYNYFDKFYFSK
ncbi:MAG: hypothetical protein H6584_08465 [Flavobacteriales bacterium]|nr:hypothetical protein [Flavobacteriales bacterium]